MSQAETIADNLLAQHRLLLAVIHTDWATRLDHKVAAVIIERYMRKQGGARVSLRYLETATGAQRPNIITSTRRLLEHGVFHVIREGKGTRPTEYGLNFRFSSSGIVDDTASDDLSSGIAGDTAGGIAGDTSSGSSGIVDDTKNLLTVTGLQAGLQVSRNEDTPDPLAAGLTATAAGSRGPFDDFWNVYPRKYQKPKARAAWTKLNPDIILAERIVAAAGRWAEHYAEHPVDKKWIPAPANWLAGERYDEDLPEVYVDAKEAAIAKRKSASKPTLQTSDSNAEWVGDVSAFVPPGRNVIQITAVEMDDGDAVVKFDVHGRDILSGFEHRFTVAEDRGSAFVDQLIVAGGLPAGPGASLTALIGCYLYAIVGDDGSIQYKPKPYDPKDAPQKRRASGLSGPHLPFGFYDVEVLKTSHEDNGDRDYKLHLDLRVVSDKARGLEFRHTLPLASVDEDEQAIANLQIAKICIAAGIVGELRNHEQLKGAIVPMHKAAKGVFYNKRPSHMGEAA